MTAHNLLGLIRPVHLVRSQDLRHPIYTMPTVVLPDTPIDPKAEAFRLCLTMRPELHCPCGEFSRLLWVLEETEHGLTVAGGRHGLMGRYHVARAALDQVRDPDQFWARVYDQIERGLVEQGA